jgi:hypothetical protein
VEPGWVDARVWGERQQSDDLGDEQYALCVVQRTHICGQGARLVSMAKEPPRHWSWSKRHQHQVLEHDLASKREDRANREPGFLFGVGFPPTCVTFIARNELELDVVMGIPIDAANDRVPRASWSRALICRESGYSEGDDHLCR